MVDFLVLIAVISSLVVALFVAIASSKPGKPLQNRTKSEPETANAPFIDFAEKEAMKLDEFKRKTGYDDLRTLGFSESEISEFHDSFFDLELRHQKQDVVRLAPQRFVDYLVWRLEEEDRSVFFFAW